MIKQYPVSIAQQNECQKALQQQKFNAQHPQVQAFIQTHKCDLCNDGLWVSFSKIEITEKQYCVECALLIAEFPNKFGVFRFDTEKITALRQPERQGCFSQKVNFYFQKLDAFFTSRIFNDYE